MVEMLTVFALLCYGFWHLVSLHLVYCKDGYMTVFYKQANELLTRPRKLSPLAPEQLDIAEQSLSRPDLAPPSVVPSLEVAVVSFSSPEYQEARRLQMERYSRACKPGEDAYQKYQATVDVAPQQTIPLVIRRQGVPLPEAVIGTFQLELPSATSIEAIARFRPDSPTASAIARRSFAEVGVFATRPGLAWAEVLDVIDTVVGSVVWLAQREGIEWLWLFPRRTLMSLLFANIPGLLPPYRFELCPDVVGWDEESERLQKMRRVGMKEVSLFPETVPIIYQITPAVWGEDLARRLALWEQRRQAADLPRLLQAAMRQGLQRVEEQVAHLHKDR
jgi:hypothetical protein